MSAKHDRKFFDTFLLVLGILVGVAIALIVVARIIAANTSVARRQDDPVYEKQVEARIHPVARDAVAGRTTPPSPVRRRHRPRPRTLLVKPCTTRPASPATGPGSLARRSTATRRPGRRASRRAWTRSTSTRLTGFQGKSGVMPPKGGRTDFTDQSVMNGVDYMVAAAK